MKIFFLLLCLTALKTHFVFSFNDMNEKRPLPFNDLNPIYFEDTSSAPYRKISDSDLQEAFAFSKELKEPIQALEETLQKQNQEYIASLGFANYP